MFNSMLPQMGSIIFVCRPLTLSIHIYIYVYVPVCAFEMNTYLYLPLALSVCLCLPQSLSASPSLSLSPSLCPPPLPPASQPYIAKSVIPAGIRSLIWNQAPGLHDRDLEPGQGKPTHTNKDHWALLEPLRGSFGALCVAAMKLLFNHHLRNVLSMSIYIYVYTLKFCQRARIHHSQGTR